MQKRNPVTLVVTGFLRGTPEGTRIRMEYFRSTLFIVKIILFTLVLYIYQVYSYRPVFLENPAIRETVRETSRPISS